ncbi:MAG: cupredoxin family copper-binding protein [Actinomycetota bacterium]|jgi:plastocyanin|nr:cupredoxin family copper-binding protein [Actinomycetota bacterium]
MNHMKRMVLVVGVVALVVAGCGDDDSDTTTTAPGAGTTTVTAGTTEAPGDATAVSIAGFAFVPADLTVPVGTTVRWTNQDNVAHTSTADDGAWDGSVSAGATFEFTFSSPGMFAYHCSIHPSMTATVTVEG